MRRTFGVYKNLKTCHQLSSTQLLNLKKECESFSQIRRTTLVHFRLSLQSFKVRAKPIINIKVTPSTVHESLTILKIVSKGFF